ncbi:citrate lyase subunit alpha, partial [Vibrio natriegens]|uniref:citrate lyase subunit alpha n=1 Tax=Vibrio natriegens TaxID=691 RepID=UPI0026E41C2F
MAEFEFNLDLPHASSLTAFGGANRTTPYLADANAKTGRKMKTDLEQAICDSGLQDGMTISFHHSFRGGDKVINMVMETIGNMGFKNLTLAPSFF